MEIVIDWYIHEFLHNVWLLNNEIWNSKNLRQHLWFLKIDFHSFTSHLVLILCSIFIQKQQTGGFLLKLESWCYFFYQDLPLLKGDIWYPCWRFILVKMSIKTSVSSKRVISAQFSPALEKLAFSFPFSWFIFYPFYQ